MSKGNFSKENTTKSVDADDNKISASSTMHRTLRVLQVIGERGPICFRPLCDALPSLSRAAVWRIASSLISYGWATRRLKDNAYELSYQLDYMIANAHFSAESIEVSRPKMRELIEDGFKDVQLGMFISLGKYAIVEGSVINEELGETLSLVFDERALEAQSYLSHEKLKHHLDVFIRYCNKAEKEFIVTGQHIQNLCTIRKPELNDGTLIFYKSSSGKLQSIPAEVKLH